MGRFALFGKGILFGCERLLFDLRCPVCGEAMRSPRDDPLCRSCCGRISSHAKVEGCRLCGDWIRRRNGLCAKCQRHPPRLEGFRTFGEYDGPLKELIKAYKYGAVLRLESVLTELLSRTHRGAPEKIDFDAVVVVPRYRAPWSQIYPMRRVARRFCRQEGLRFIPGALIKTRATPAQASLSGRARELNLKGAFAIGQSEHLAGYRVLLLDDVSTTGSTLRYAAEVLAEAGARVWALVLAKAR